MVATIEKEMGIIDILVNNTGIIKRIPAVDMKVEEFEEVIDVDLSSTLHRFEGSGTLHDL